MKFASSYQPNKSMPVPSGTQIVDEYGWKVDKNTGKKYIGVVGKKDIYTPIQAALDSTYLNNVVERFQNGGISVGEFDEYLNAVKTKSVGLFDSLGMPKSLAEVQQSIIAADAVFGQLNPEVRDIFGQSQQAFEKAIIDGTAKDKLSAYIESKKGVAQKNAEAKIQEVKNES